VSIVIVKKGVCEKIISRYKCPVYYPVWYEPSCFPRILTLKDNYPSILSELQKLPINILDRPRPTAIWTKCSREWKSYFKYLKNNQGWVIGLNSDGDWLNYPLCVYDKPSGLNSSACPETMHVLRQIKGIRMAGFSLLKAKGRIKPHYDSSGMQYNSLTCHLGLVVNGKSVLIVNGQHKEQRAGELLLFDATYTHAVFNFSNYDRFILYLDMDVRDSSC